MAINYRGFLLNEPGDAPDWGQKELNNFKGLIDKALDNGLQEITDINSITTNAISIGEGINSNQALTKSQIELLISSVTIPVTPLDGEHLLQDNIDNDAQMFIVADEYVLPAGTYSFNQGYQGPNNEYVFTAGKLRMLDGGTVNFEENPTGSGDSPRLQFKCDVYPPKNGTFDIAIPMYFPEFQRKMVFENDGATSCTYNITGNTNGKYSIIEIEQGDGAGLVTVNFEDFDRVEEWRFPNGFDIANVLITRNGLDITSTLSNYQEFWLNPQDSTKIDKNPDYIDFNPSLSELPPFLEGRRFYNPFEFTMQTYSNNADFPVIDGQNLTARGKNETTETILKGSAVYFLNVESGGVGLNIQLALASEYNKNWAVFIAVQDIPVGEYGTCARYGTLLNIDTTGLVAGKETYLSATVAGAFTQDRPDFPATPILLGAPIVIGTEGVAIIFIQEENYDYEFDGCIIEQHDYEIVVEGTQVFLDLFNKATPTKKLPVQLSGSYYELDTLTGAGVGGRARVELIQGTATSAVRQVTYIDIVADEPVLKVVAGYPATPFAQVGEHAIQDYATVDVNKAIKDRRNTTAKSVNGRGLLSYISEVLGIRAPEMNEDTGIIPTATIDTVPTPDVVNPAVTSGFIYQKLRQQFPALNIVDDGFYVLNASGAGTLTKNQKINNLILANELTDGTAVTNGRMHLVLVGLVNKTATECKIGILLPNDQYAVNNTDAWKDANSTAVTGVDIKLKNVSFLIMQVPLKITSSGDSAEFIMPVGMDDIIDLRGQTLGSSGGGVGSGGGASSQGTDNINISDGAGGFALSPFKKATGGGMEIDGSAVTIGERSWAIWDGVKYVASVIGDATNLLVANIQTLAANDATIGNSLHAIGKIFAGGDQNNPTAYNAVIEIAPEESTGFLFSSTPNAEDANGQYVDNATTQNGSPVYKKSGELWYLFKMLVAGQNYWAIHTSVIDGDVNWNLVTYRQTTAATAPDVSTYEGLAVNGATNSQGSITATIAGEDGLNSARFMKLQKTAAELAANADPEDIVNSDYVTNGFVPLTGCPTDVDLNGKKLSNVSQLDVLGTGTLRTTTKSTTGAAIWVADSASGQDSAVQLYENGVLKWTIAQDSSDASAYVIKTSDGGVKFRVGADGVVTTPNATQAKYDADVTGKIVPTKENVTAAIAGVATYTEGSWTPTVAFGGGNTGMVVTTSGAYSKVGKQVTVHGYISFSNKGTSTGNISIDGLPFAVADSLVVTNIEASGSCGYYFNMTLPSTQAILVPSAVAGSGLRLRSFSNTSAGEIDDTDFASNSSLNFSITYITD